MATWDKDKPAGSQKLRLADDDIRDNQDALEDAIGRDHDFPGTYGDDAGKHDKVTLQEQGSDPTTAANEAALYTKEQDSETELFMIGESAPTAVQVTEGSCEYIRKEAVELLKDLGGADLVSTTATQTLTNKTITGGTVNPTTLQVGGDTVVSSPTFSDNSNGNPNIDDSVFDVKLNVTEATWEAVGPLGAGAHDWASLSSVPTDADWVRIRFLAYGSDGSASSDLEISVYVRATGSSQGAGLDNQIIHAYGRADGSGNGNISDTNSEFIQIDSSRKFDIYWSGNCTTENIKLVLVGYGKNP